MDGQAALGLIALHSRALRALRSPQRSGGRGECRIKAARMSEAA
ncbi:hypothetical protein HMPREF0731_4086 [Pseudoroseomonas cervicalis ATCC 49957]|uniref:Uncharacterized protein n=1 Tax=Pseudoroseomonas cervicalis ATCC 49957 TaxID=525371 RepID=D5RSM4_9PROT|nr:hypothetical protein HMPREF0731_4086 [Pseudoroseomonas cervicalis ATCC 49957]